MAEKQRLSNMDSTGLEIAVIGMTVKLPGARNINEFWHNLKNGVESITFFSDDELKEAGKSPDLLNESDYVKAFGIIEKPDYFDAIFFDYTPLEARVMDPQQRIFHECVWAALEDAGYVPDTCNKLIGLYAGATPNFNWEALTYLADKEEVPDRFSISILNDKDFMTTRVSYLMNLKGPSFSLFTACSTSLVAIDLACRGILMGQCDMALAGGVTINHEKTGYKYREGMIYSPDGHCRAFDARAQGTVFGSGIGIVVLKALEDAIADRDYIYAVIKGSAINNDGNRKAGYTAPGVQGQIAVIRNAQQMARVVPESIGFIETHGTGTALGDPIEIKALKLAFNSDKKNYCAIGAVKSNVGHLNAAAGVAGFIKTVLALKHQLIPPTLHVSCPNPKIDFENSPFYVNTTLREWGSNGYPRRAGVSSFGIGGTNAHVVLEEWLDDRRQGTEASRQGTGDREYQLILLSAKTQTALEKMTDNLVEHVKTHLLNGGDHENPVHITNVAHTLQIGRKGFKYRKTVVCSSLEMAVDALSGKHNGSKLRSSFVKRENPPVIFMFPGQGAQYVDMGRELYEKEPVFLGQMDRCFEILRPLMGYDIKEILYPSPVTRHPSPDINQTEITQPLLFIFEYALAKLLKHCGVKPYAMIGHSIGEYTAACISGVLSLEDALSLVVLRGKLMQSLPAGAMLSVSLPADQLEPLLVLNKKVSMAAVNSPSHCVVSGPLEAIEDFAGKLEAKGHPCKPLHTSHAFHSGMMDPILEAFQEKMVNVSLKSPKIPYISNVTGKWISSEEVKEHRYWVDHIRKTVRFADGLEELLAEKHSVFLEIGPGTVLSTFVKHYFTAEETAPMVANLIRHPQKKVSDKCYMLNQLSLLWLFGVTLDGNKFYTAQKKQRIPLPSYPFEGQSYRIRQDMSDLKVKALDLHSLEGKKDIAQWFYVPSWERSLYPVFNRGKPVNRGHWLIFGNGCRLTAALVQKLEQMGQHWMIVEAGAEFTQPNQQQFVINPLEEKHYHNLFKTLADSNQLPGTIIHLWNITGHTGRKLQLEEIEKIQNHGFHSLLNIARAVGLKGLQEGIKIGVITGNLQEVTGEETLCPEKATVLGAVNVIPLEYHNISCFSLDIQLPVPGSCREEKLMERLIAEFAAVPADRIIAYRGNHRWVRNYKAIQLERPESTDRAQRLRKEGVYLITGGLGGIGLTAAEYLAKAVKARLILTGRWEFPAREEWEQWLSTHDQQDVVSRRIRKVRQLEEWGAKVMVVQADTANRQQMQQAIFQAEQQLGLINGVIHCAGLPDGGIIQRRTRQMTERVFKPKIWGTLVLDDILKDKKLDFFILCSSLSSILAPAGEVAYCAANAFLDAFAHYKSTVDDTFTVSINWDAWQQVGMAVDAINKRFKTVFHPLFDHCLIDNHHPQQEQKIYVSDYSVKKHWVLSDHKIMGKGTLSGTTCLEMVRAAFEEYTGHETAEIREVYFFTPLMLKDEENKEVRTILEQKGDTFEFLVISKNESTSGDKASDNRWLKHAAGKITEPEQKFLKDRSIEIKEIEAKCQKKEITFSDRQSHPGGKLLELGPRWKNRKQVKFGINQGVALLELPVEFEDDVKSYKLHPALLDNATSFLLGGLQTDQQYLPFSYKKLLIKRPLEPKIFSFARYVENNRQNKKTLSFKIEITDIQGQVLVEIEEFTLLAVPKNAGNSTAGMLPVKVRHKAPENDVQNSGLKAGILPNEGIEVFQRILGGNLPQVIVSTRDFLRRFERANSLTGSTSPEIPNKLAASTPLHSRTRLDNTYVAPANETERKICEIWQQFLGIDKVGIHDDFFQLGGDSLKAIYLLSKINKKFDIQVPLAEIFNRPTVAELVDYINESQKSAFIEIAPVEKKEYYELSSEQIRLYFLHQLAPEIGNLFNTVVLEDIRQDLANKTIRKMIERHESLRTSIHIEADKPVQRIQEPGDINFEIQYYEADEKEARTILETFVRPYALNQAPLLRAGAIKIGKSRYILAVDMHHIVTDGTSFAIFQKEFVELYEGQELPALKIQYKDYSHWQHKEKENENVTLKAQKGYWLKQFAGEIPLLDLPTDYARPAEQSFAGNHASFQVNTTETNALRNIANEVGATLYMVLLAIYYILLSKLSGQEDIVIGTPIAGRRRESLQQIIGLFINTLALRNYPKPNKTFKEFLEEIKERTLKAFENQEFQFEELVMELDLKRNLDRNPLFDVVFVYYNIYTPGTEVKTSLREVEPFEYDDPISKFDMTLEGYELAKNLIFKIEYSTKLFKKETLERFIRFFKRIISSIVADPGQKIVNIEIITEGEKKRILNEFNTNYARYPEGKTLHQLFAEQVEQTPDHVALLGQSAEHKGQSKEEKRSALCAIRCAITYRELNEKANQLAHLLNQKSVQADTIVGIMVERSFEMIIGILAILKSGGAYLPIDPDYPVERIKYLLKDSRANILVTTPGLSERGWHEKLSIVNCQLLMVNETLPNRRRRYHTPKETNSINNYQLTINNSQLNSTNLAYIIYTSGTTGKPKGVMVEHRNVVQLMFHNNHPFDFNNRDVWTMFHSYCFDFSIWEMYGALLYGGKLIIISKMTAKDPNRFLNILKKESVTILNQTPTAFYNLVDEELTLLNTNENKELKLKYVIFGGEALSPVKLKEWKLSYPKTKLVNMFGITETTVHVTYIEIKAKEIDLNISNIGRPIATLYAFVMDTGLNLLPAGIAGELCVGGVGVARGYLNREKLTREKFVENPFKRGEKLYRSGDMVRCLDNGEMEYMGRIDHQVKIRGYRIELGEIESRLLERQEIKEVVVMTRENEKGDKCLYAYIVPIRDFNASSTVSGLREYLAKSLPSYMIPTHYVKLEKLPLTPNGKVDRKALPIPGLGVDTEIIVPHTAIEKKLVEIWSEVLAVDKESIGIDQDYFQLGGHSLNATRMAVKVRKEFNVKLPLAQVFKKPTIRGLAAFILTAEKVEFVSLAKVEAKEYYELSFNQKRLWIINQFQQNISSAYNMPGGIVLEYHVEEILLKQVLVKIVKQHESFRTGFKMVKSEPKQFVVEAEQLNIPFKKIDLSFLENQKKMKKRKEIFADEAAIPFDLMQVPLFRTVLVKLDEEQYELIFNMHHIISDGTSLTTIAKDFMRLYRGEKLPPLKLQYKDYSEWQNRRLQHKEVNKQANFWLKLFDGEIPVSNMPTDYPRPPVMDFTGGAHRFELNESLTSNLRALVCQNNTTLFITLLAAYSIVLGRFTGQEDIIIGSPTAGRNHADLENIVGMFANTVAFRCFPKPHKRFGEFLEEVNHTAVKVFENQEYPFEMLFNRLELKRDLSRTPLFDTVINVLNIDGQNPNDTTITRDIKFSMHPFEETTSKFDITIYVNDIGKKIRFNCTYRTSLFKRSTIEYLMGEYLRLLEEIVREPGKLLKDYEIFSRKHLKVSKNRVSVRTVNRR